MKYLTLLIFIVILKHPVSSQAVENRKYCIYYPRDLVTLANKLGMELLSGNSIFDETMLINRGLPYVFFEGGYDQKEKIRSIYWLFWCIKEGKCFLTFALEEIRDKFDGTVSRQYKIIDTISQKKLYGHSGLSTPGGEDRMYVYDGSLGTTMELSQFTYLDNPQKRGPAGLLADGSNGFLPVIMSSENATFILYRYKDKWLKYHELYEW